ncbi:MAG: hypothetical protein D6705_10475 [Deltaproteobacteria bacterium]|nr:MAG: hypothetical protein D6705_10475 [Deltaproteobacteria bacterium]
MSARATRHAFLKLLAGNTAVLLLGAGCGDDGGGSSGTGGGSTGGSGTGGSGTSAASGSSTSTATTSTTSTASGTDGSTTGGSATSGSDTGTAGGSSGGVGACSEPPVAMIANNHPAAHSLVVPLEDVEAGVDKVYDIQGASAHPHTVMVSAADFAALAAGDPIQIESSLDAGHTHLVTIVCG